MIASLLALAAVLGQPSFAETDDGGREITFINGEGQNLQRAIYRVSKEGHLTWQGDASDDGGATWDEAVMVIDCARAKMTGASEEG